MSPSQALATATINITITINININININVNQYVDRYLAGQTSLYLFYYLLYFAAGIEPGLRTYHSGTNSTGSCGGGHADNGAQTCRATD